MALQAPVQVSITALDAVVQGENLGQPHVALAAEPMWRDSVASREYLDQGLAELRQTGLAGPRGLAPDFRDVVTALARPEHEFCALIAADERKLNVLAVSAGREAVLAVNDLRTITLHPIRPDALAEAVIAQLPKVPPLRTRAVNVLEHEFNPDAAPRPRTRQDEGFTGLDQNQAAPNPDIAHLRRILNLPKLGGGHLYTGIRLPSGRRVRCPQPLGVIDTPEGRYLTQTTISRSGDRWLVAAPASPELLVTRLYEMHHALG